VSTVPAEAALTAGYEALATGNWAAARDAFMGLLDRSETPEALDGLGRALWWLGDERGAIVNRERAYAGFRRDGDLARAARIALWLSREYTLAYGNEAAARGWLARAERLLRDVAPGVDGAWLDLALSERSRDSSESAGLAAAALEVALTTGDADLELRSLAQLGLAEVALGRVDSGLGRLDEAMAAVMSGEPATLETFADVACSLMLLRSCRGFGAAAAMGSRLRGFRPQIRSRDTTRVLPHLLRGRVRRQGPNRRGRGGVIDRNSRAHRSRPALTMPPSGGAARRDSCVAGSLC
jgi:hypothetical protein